MEQPHNFFLEYIDAMPVAAMRKNAAGAYSWIQEFEREVQIPVSEMDRSNLIALLNSQKSASPNTIRNNILLLRSFFTWMTESGVLRSSPADGLHVRDIDLMGGCSYRYYSDYVDLLHTLSRVRRSDEGYAAYPISVFAWLGIEMKDAKMILDHQVDLERKTIETENGGEYVIDDTMSFILRQYREFTHSTRENGITMVRSYGTNQFLQVWDMQNGKQDRKPCEISISSVLYEMSQLLKEKKIPKHLAYVDIQKSGALSRVYARERNGMSITEALAQERPILRPSKAYPGDLHMVYEAYKDAFNLS